MIDAETRRLVKAAQHGDESAFNTLYFRHFDTTVWGARRVLEHADYTDADQVARDIVLGTVTAPNNHLDPMLEIEGLDARKKAWASIKRYNPDLAAVQTWLSRIAESCARDFLKTIQVSLRDKRGNPYYTASLSGLDDNAEGQASQHGRGAIRIAEQLQDFGEHAQSFDQWIEATEQEVNKKRVLAPFKGFTLGIHGPWFEYFLGRAPQPYPVHDDIDAYAGRKQCAHGIVTRKFYRKKQRADQTFYKVQELTCGHCCSLGIPKWKCPVHRDEAEKSYREDRKAGAKASYYFFGVLSASNVKDSLTAILDYKPLTLPDRNYSTTPNHGAILENGQVIDPRQRRSDAPSALELAHLSDFEPKDWRKRKVLDPSDFAPAKLPPKILPRAFDSYTMAQWVREAADSLAKDDRQIFNLRRHGITVGEIAEQLHIKHKAAAARVKAINKTMRQCLLRRSAEWKRQQVQGAPRFKRCKTGMPRVT